VAFRSFPAVASTAAALLVTGCSYDWDKYDPRLADAATGGTNGAGGSSAGSSGLGGADSGGGAGAGVGGGAGEGGTGTAGMGGAGLSGSGGAGVSGNGGAGVSGNGGTGAGGSAGTTGGAAGVGGSGQGGAVGGSAGKGGAAGGPTCPGMDVGGVCYFLDKQSVQQNKGDASCASMLAGAHLAVFPDLATQKLVMSTQGLSPGADAYFFGLTCKQGCSSAMSWSWETGAVPSYSNWTSSQPKSGCAVLKASAYDWATQQCDQQLPLVCSAP
jgi:hypothetical protein